MKIHLATAVLAALPVIVHAQPPGIEKMAVVTEKVAEGVYMLKGAGGQHRPFRG